MQLQTRRLFIGLPISQKLTKRLYQEADEWRSFPVLLTRPDHYHVTLLFLGFIYEEEIPRITGSLQEIARVIEPFELVFDRISAQPVVRPNMVWLMGEASSELTTLHNRVAEALEYLTPASKAFRPHITLAKIRRGKFEKLEMKPSFDRTVSFVEPIDTFVLYESTTVDGKRTYIPLDEFSLG